MSEDKTTQSKSWIDRLKQESWEAELLIATVAIIGSFQLVRLTKGFANIAIDYLPPSQYLFGYGVVFLSLLAASILTTMFIIHFCLRAYWVGLVGLNSVFPDYSLEDSAYSEIYTRKMTDMLPKMEDTIQQIDDLCSVIFSAAFSLLMMYGYGVFLAVVGFLTFNRLYLQMGPIGQGILRALLLIAVFLPLPVMIIANNKRFKKNERVQNLYFNLVKWQGLLFIGPFFKNVYQISMTFGSNFKKKKSLVYFVIAALVSGMIFAMVGFLNSRIPYLLEREITYNETMLCSGFYEDQTNEKEFLISPQIDADVFHNEVMTLFIPVFNYERRMFKELCGYKEHKPKEEDELQWYLDCYETYHKIYLDGELIDADFIKYKQPQTNQFGLLMYVDLEGNTRGQHEVKIVKELEEAREWTVPFQYYPKSN